MMGAFDLMVALQENQTKVQQAFRTGGGVAWGDQAGCMFCASSALFPAGLLQQSCRTVAPCPRWRGV